MRAVRLGLLSVVSVALIIACSGSKLGSGFGGNGVDSGGVPPGTDGSQPPPSGDGAPSFGDSGAVDAPPPDGSVTVATTIYANTDTMLYSMDPMSQAVTPVGMFAGTSDSSVDSTVTDVAVDAEGDVYVNTESVVYKAALPATPGASATVMLTQVATLTSGQKFYALAFVPAGALGSGETLVGGDGNGSLWAINTTTGATQNLGSFGADPTQTGSTAYSYVLSGDLVFYDDSSNTPTGLVTIRSCKTSKLTECYPTGEAGDFLAQIDMTALKTAYTSNTPAASLLKGIYGATMTTAGPGTGYVKLFGLGAWNSNVYAFSRNDQYDASGQPPSLISISTTTGAGTVISAAFPFTNGWSGAGVSTKVTIMVPPPPPPPQ